MNRSRTNPNFSQIALSANSSDVFRDATNRTFQQSFIQERKYRNYAEVVKGKPLDVTVDHGNLVESQSFARKSTKKKALPKGHQNTSQNHVISDKALGNFLVAAINRMLKDGNSVDLAKELFERKVRAFGVFLNRIFHKKEGPQIKEAKGLLTLALSGGKKGDIYAFANYVASNASNNAVEGDASANSGIGEKMDAPVDLQGRLLPFFERVRKYFLELANELTWVFDDAQVKVCRDVGMQTMVLDAISPDIVAGRVRASARSYTDHIGQGRSFEAPGNLSGRHDERFLTSGKVTVLSPKRIRKKGLTKAQGEHFKQGLLHHRATSPKHPRSCDEDLAVMMKRLLLEPLPSQNVQQDLDFFNLVFDNSNLTQQNVDFLLKKALEEMGYSEAQIDDLVRQNFMIVPISHDGSLDHALRDAILHFLGQDPAVANFTMFLCSGALEGGQVVGNSHWTSLSLNMLEDGGVIEVLHANSLGDSIPLAVDRVIAGIADVGVADVRGSDGVVSDLHQRALARLGQVAFCKARAVKCPNQDDGFSCGYHAVFNGVLMGEGCVNEDDELDLQLLQNGEMIEIEEFIENRRQDLQERFNQNVEIKDVLVDDFFDAQDVEEVEVADPYNRMSVQSVLVGILGASYKCEEKLGAVLCLQDALLEAARLDFEDCDKIIENLSSLKLQQAISGLVGDCCAYLWFCFEHVGAGFSYSRECFADCLSEICQRKDLYHNREFLDLLKELCEDFCDNKFEWICSELDVDLEVDEVDLEEEFPPQSSSSSVASPLYSDVVRGVLKN